jgi:hypothetical protein
MKLLVFLQTDCPTCRLAVPYLNRLAGALDGKGAIQGVSQDPDQPTGAFIASTRAAFPISVDQGWKLTKHYTPEFVPAFFLLDESDRILKQFFGFSKGDLNQVSSSLGAGPVADSYDGNPESKPGCVSRHLEDGAPEPIVDGPSMGRASRVEATGDSWEFARDLCGDPLPVVPPTVERVERMLAGYDPEELIAEIPPNYGPATIEKIAANAVMAGCDRALLPVLITVVRAACDERFNIHGVQATTHFAAPLVLINGPVRERLRFWSKGNVFSNVARANSTLGRAFQLILTNIGGARPGEIDMSALGNAGKFSFVIAENEEESPWEPFYPESAATLFACEAPHGFSEHTARTAPTLLRAFATVAACAWSPRVCGWPEILVVVCPEHARTLAREGLSKNDVREWLWNNTGVPVAEYDGDAGEGTQLASTYERIEIRGVPCYRKFKDAEQIRIVVAGGTAGKFSAVLPSWATGPRGSQVVTYPIR